MHPTLSRVVSGWAIAGAVCLLAPLCPRPAHASGPTLGLGRKRATVALRLPIVSPLRTIHVGQYPALVTVDVRDRHIFVADQGHLGGDHTLPDGPGSVAMVDEGNGVVLRTIPVSQAPVALAVDAPAQRVFVLCTGRIDTVNGFMSRGGSVSVLDAVTGAVVRTLSVGPVPLQVSGSGAAPTARQALVVDSTNGRVYVSTSATVLVLDGMTGVVRRTIAVRGGITPSVIAPSVIAVDGRARRLYMGDSGDTTMPFLPSSSVSGLFGVLDAATGKGIANVAVTQSGISVIAVDERAGRVLVFELHGNREYSTVVDVLDARSGKLLHTTDLGYPRTEASRSGSLGRRAASLCSIFLVSMRPPTAVASGWWTYLTRAMGTCFAQPCCRRSDALWGTPWGRHWRLTGGTIGSWSPMRRGILAARIRASPLATSTCSTRAAVPSCAACRLVQGRRTWRSTRSRGASSSRTSAAIH